MLDGADYRQAMELLERFEALKDRALANEVPGLEEVGPSDPSGSHPVGSRGNDLLVPEGDGHLPEVPVDPGDFGAVEPDLGHREESLEDQAARAANVLAGVPA